ncbi:hypothetical protein KBK19_17255 [Microvirga sp. STR05]|uniref:Uncharacterized protein n=1 Tax=Hymenobacter duratus TaxID=2771356 RepID=A0ABR8JIV6_9BACT|nr:hypothetical protein [Hymenobacter duratus]MBD2716796.1 hypothetical protein [Hymenobacter duratus]MBR7951711.1 hypothetical protein [Microvirga sp. STR05]
MDANQYKQMKEHGNVLDFATLNDTRKVLAQRGQADLADLVTRILSNGKIDKPRLHNAPLEHFSDFYRVSLAAEDVAAIVSVLFDYETEVVDINPSAAELIDRWNNLNELLNR